MIDAVVGKDPKLKKMRVKVFWDGKLTIDQSKYFAEKMEGYKEVIWIFKSALDLTDGKATEEELELNPDDKENLKENSDGDKP